MNEYGCKAKPAGSLRCVAAVVLLAIAVNGDGDAQDYSIVFPADLDKLSPNRTIGHNVTETWEISCGADSFVNLTRAYLDTQRKRDFIRVYGISGDELDSWSGFDRFNRLFSFEANITIEFTSDSVGASKGFELYWTCQPVQCDRILYTTGQRLTEMTPVNYCPSGHVLAPHSALVACADRLCATMGERDEATGAHGWWMNGRAHGCKVSNTYVPQFRSSAICWREGPPPGQGCKVINSTADETVTTKEPCWHSLCPPTSTLQLRFEAAAGSFLSVRVNHYENHQLNPGATISLAPGQEGVILAFNEGTSGNSTFSFTHSCRSEADNGGSCVSVTSASGGYMTSELPSACVQYTCEQNKVLHMRYEFPTEARVAPIGESNDRHLSRTGTYVNGSPAANLTFAPIHAVGDTTTIYWYCVGVQQPIPTPGSTCPYKLPAAGGLLRYPWDDARGWLNYREATDICWTLQCEAGEAPWAELKVFRWPSSYGRLTAVSGGVAVSGAYLRHQKKYFSHNELTLNLSVTDLRGWAGPFTQGLLIEYGCAPGTAIVFPAALDKLSPAHTIGHNLKRTWKAACGANRVVNVKRAYFNTQHSSDFVRIYDESGDVLESWSGYLGEDYFTFGASITVEFTSDWGYSSKGFELYWTCQEKPTPPGTAIVFPADLDKLSPARTIGHNVTETWEVACGANRVVNVTRAYFNTQRYSDFVRIYDESGDELESWSGYLGEDHFTFGASITIEFTSDRSYSSKGFELYWTCQAEPGPSNSTSPEKVRFVSADQSFLDQPAGGYCEAPCLRHWASFAIDNNPNGTTPIPASGWWAGNLSHPLDGSGVFTITAPPRDRDITLEVTLAKEVTKGRGIACPDADSCTVLTIELGRATTTITVFADSANHTVQAIRISPRGGGLSLQSVTVMVAPPTATPTESVAATATEPPQATSEPSTPTVTGEPSVGPTTTQSEVRATDVPAREIETRSFLLYLRLAATLLGVLQDIARSLHQELAGRGEVVVHDVKVRYVCDIPKERAKYGILLSDKRNGAVCRSPTEGRAAAVLQEAGGPGCCERLAEVDVVTVSREDNEEKVRRAVDTVMAQTQNKALQAAEVVTPDTVKAEYELVWDKALDTRQAGLAQDAVDVIKTAFAGTGAVTGASVAVTAYCNVPKESARLDRFTHCASDVRNTRVEAFNTVIIAVAAVEAQELVLRELRRLSADRGTGLGALGIVDVLVPGSSRKETSPEDTGTSKQVIIIFSTLGAVLVVVALVIACLVWKKRGTAGTSQPPPTTPRNNPIYQKSEPYSDDV